jgi:hypothetical protein
MKKLIFASLVGIALLGCKKSNSGNWYGGMQIVDSNFKFERWSGPADYDWLLNKYSFTKQQLALFKIDSNLHPDWYFTDTGTVIVTPGVNPVFYDTPSVYYSFTVFVQKKCMVSYTVTNDRQVVLAQGNIYAIDSQLLYPTVQIPAHYLQAGQVIRVYYSCSAAGRPNFAKGWGDIGLCSPNGYGRTSKCF